MAERKQKRGIRGGPGGSIAQNTPQKSKTCPFARRNPTN